MSLWPRQRPAPWLPKSEKAHLDRKVWITIALVLVISCAASYAILLFTGEMRYAVWFSLALVGCVFAGRVIGEYAWTVVGTRYTALILRLYAHWGRKRGGKMMITPYPDFVPGRLRQTWEAMGFAAGLSMMLAATILFVTEEDSEALPWLALAGLVLSMCLTFMLVPHWTFARLGLRITEPRRFVVRSLAESYTAFVQVSNGTMVLGSSFWAINALAGRAARVEIWLLVGVSMATLLAVSVVAMGTATAYYKKHEEKVLKRVAADAKRLGFVAMTSGNVAASL